MLFLLRYANDSRAVARCMSALAKPSICHRFHIERHINVIFFSVCFQLCTHSFCCCCCVCLFSVALWLGCRSTFAIVFFLVWHVVLSVAVYVCGRCCFSAALSFIAPSLFPRLNCGLSLSFCTHIFCVRLCVSIFALFSISLKLTYCHLSCCAFSISISSKRYQTFNVEKNCFHLCGFFPPTKNGSIP